MNVMIATAFWMEYVSIGAAATTTISTDPPNNPLATGFNNLIVTAQFPTPTDSSDACSWYYGGELDSGSGASFYLRIFGCDPPAPGTYDSITCTEQTIDGTSHIITTLTITQPLVAGNVNIEVRCSIATNTPGPITRTVQDCPSSLSYGVVITSSSRTYQASGMFSCPTGDLFYSNGTTLPSGDTTCLANAEWSGQKNLQCASATAKISTNPPNNPLATGFNNLIVTAQFPTPTSNTDSCYWYYGGELDSGTGAQFYSGVFGGCFVPSPGTYDSITCTEQTIDGTNHTITTLTITQPLVAGDFDIEVRCVILTNTPGPVTRTVQDCPSSLSYGVVITSSSRTYQASGMFSCPTGDLFYSNGTAPSSSNTICLANAQWLAQDNLQCTGASPGTKISTNPPNNPLATGFNNLIVTAQFPTPTSSSDSCSWYYGGELDSGSGASFYSGVFGCNPPAPGTYDSITCTEQTIDGTSHVVPTLTITQPLVAGSLNIEVRCAIAVIIPGSVTALVQDCPSSLPYDVVFTSSSQTYRASGMFSCPTGDLFYSNGTPLPSGDTVCLANAEWSGQNYLQCWSASDPFMTGNLIVPEGDTTSLNCNYDETVFPEVTSSIFYFDEIGYIVSKDEMFHLKLEKEDNMKPISCQVVTSYTQIYNNTGRSSVEHVNVQYAPYGMKNISCSWTIDKTGICDISFFSNPEMKFVFLSLNDKAVSNDGKDIVFSNGYEHHYLYTRNQVTSSDEGTYKLTLSHLLPPYNYSIEFDVIVVNIDQLPTPDNTGAIVGGTVAAVALICITVVVALYITTRQPTKNGKSTPRISHVTSPEMLNEAYIEFDNTTQSNAKVTMGLDQFNHI
ncbi:uncharacterized protein LOC143446477 [Clavelina lepadiformis]|uniref:uncharacterized protein LOC143446477 n=1 Tax=Clavelina lepadiformis TaxID=159417 RepID=UPI0040417EF9